jgi:hypothetical protein
MGEHAGLAPSKGSIATDPLVVYPIEAALADGDESFEDGEGSIVVAPDDLHKANTSGGEPYEIAIPGVGADRKLVDPPSPATRASTSLFRPSSPPSAPISCLSNPPSQSKCTGLAGADSDFPTQISGRASFTGTQNETLSSGWQRALNYALDRLVRNQMAEPAFINALQATR